MTAAEIRKAVRMEGIIDLTDFSEAAKVMMLAEIAAQLAELNQVLRDVHPELKLPDECREKRCEYWTCYFRDGAENMTHQAYHLECARASEHFKDCKYDGPTVCKTCERLERLLRA